MDIYAVKSVATEKVVENGFDKKSDAKIRRNALCEKTWEKFNKKYKGIKEKPAKPFPFIVTKGKEHPNYNG